MELQIIYYRCRGPGPLLQFGELCVYMCWNGRWNYGQFSFSTAFEKRKMSCSYTMMKTHPRIRMLCDGRHRGRNVHGGFEIRQVDSWGQGASASVLCSQEAGILCLSQSSPHRTGISLCLHHTEHSANRGGVLLLFISTA